MHGVVLKGAGHYCINSDPELVGTRAHEFRDNGLHVGQWFANTYTARFTGAHGNVYGGVYYNAKGAYSILVSNGGFTGLDNDQGNTVLHSPSEARIIRTLSVYEI